MSAEQEARRAAARAGQQVARKMQAMRAPSATRYTLPILDDHPPAGDPTNLYGFDDGRLFFVGSDGTVHELVGGTDSGASTDPKVEDKQTKKFTKRYNATWGRTLCPRHGVETGNDLSYGRYSSTHGERKVMIGFDNAQIASDLAGADIRMVQIHMRNAHAYYNGGIEVFFGAHDKTAPSGRYSSKRERVFHDHWPKSGDGKYWRRAPSWFGDRFRDGAIAGLTINQPGGGLQYYGAVAWRSVSIKITYTKQV